MREVSEVLRRFFEGVFCKTSPQKPGWERENGDLKVLEVFLDILACERFCTSIYGGIGKETSKTFFSGLLPRERGFCGRFWLSDPQKTSRKTSAKPPLAITGFIREVGLI